MGKYRKKPVVIEAEVYKQGMEDGWGCSGGFSDCRPNLPSCALACDFKYWRPFISTLEGNLFISDGDYIITGIKGERYPCKPGIFEQTYEPVEEK
jgi:hypothetical protein